VASFERVWTNCWSGNLTMAAQSLFSRVWGHERPSLSSSGPHSAIVECGSLVTTGATSAGSPSSNGSVLSTHCVTQCQ